MKKELTEKELTELEEYQNDENIIPLMINNKLYIIPSHWYIHHCNYYIITGMQNIYICKLVKDNNNVYYKLLHKEVLLKGERKMKDNKPKYHYVLYYNDKYLGRDFFLHDDIDNTSILVFFTQNKAKEYLRELKNSSDANDGRIKDVINKLKVKKIKIERI